MPHKSRRSRRKFTPGKMKGAQSTPATVTHQHVAAPTGEPVPRSEVSAPIARASAPTAGATGKAASLAVTEYPYLGAELRMIGILTGSLLLILVILALVLF